MITEKLRPELAILFVGFNPSLTSYERGFNYAGRSNRFYRILFESGLTDRQYAPEESPNLLDDYQYGFTNLVARPTQRADELSRSEYREGAHVLRRKLEEFAPRVACYVGKGVYEQFTGRRKVTWGVQKLNEVPGVIDFVGPSSSGLVRMTLAAQVEIYSELAQLLKCDADSTAAGASNSPGATDASDLTR
ncbi:mismatch-specific DNA-glycosylase [Alicyclobacillus sp. ALC3]|uniref:mismatch-specific DNA-glycosylase n=1 Tax=Alicyclobacillus sp. ALC3 TaxID=2796143 RepID=UPI002379A6B8|nr:mismatch-specific DNA-glycosylase [Alicyclobacillus sp. ALC3]WDL98728.1 mismatch-specific DNA-glycosylase [Alicyclobacillus sp. ALC3]